MVTVPLHRLMPGEAKSNRDRLHCCALPGRHRLVPGVLGLAVEQRPQWCSVLPDRFLRRAGHIERPLVAQHRAAYRPRRARVGGQPGARRGLGGQRALAPSDASASAIGKEANAGASHFGVSGPNADVFLVSPTGTHPDGFSNTGFGAWHDWNGRVPFTKRPFPARRRFRLWRQLGAEPVRRVQHRGRSRVRRGIRSPPAAGSLPMVRRTGPMRVAEPVRDLTAHRVVRRASAVEQRGGPVRHES